MILSLALLPPVLAGANLSAVDVRTDVQQQYQQWERRFRAKVAELNVLPASDLKDPACDVLIGFAVGRNRRPADIEIVKSSCSPFHVRKAYRLVRQLGRIGQVPSASGKNYRVLLNLSYGEAPDAVADRSLTNALEAERQIHSRRNLAIVTRSANRTSATNQRSAEK